MRRVLLAVLLAAAAACPALAGDVDRAKSAADALGEAATVKYGNPDAFQQNAAKPATSRETPMTTLNGSVSFDAQFSCPSTSRFLDVFIQPSGTGDLSFVQLSQDTNLDGTDDYLYTVPFSVSGVCANGLIGCDPGTWSGCTYWKWTTDSSSRVSLASSALGQLGGCYCINNSCGSGLAWANPSVILKDIGGGAVGALQSADPKFSITDAKIVDLEIMYYGQSLAGCSKTASLSGSNSPEQYYASGLTDAGLLSATDTEVTNQQSDPDSYYNLIAQSLAAQNSLGGYKSCSLTRTISYLKQTSCSHGGSYMEATDNCVDIDPSCGSYCSTLPGCSALPTDPATVSGPQEWTWSIYRVTCSGNTLNFYCKNSNAGGLVKVMTIQGMSCSSDIRFNSKTYLQRMVGNGQGIDLYTCEENPDLREDSPQYINCGTRAGTLATQGAIVTGSTRDAVGLIDAVSGGMNPYAVSTHHSTYWPTWDVLHFYRAKCQYPADKQDVMSEAVNDQCQAYESDSKCRIQQEKVDGVYTIKNYNSTGLVPFPTCRDFTGFQTHSVCRDWWQKDRTYFCQEDGQFNFDDIKERSRVIHESVTGGTGQHQYRDITRDASGQWVQSGGTFDTSLAEGDDPQPCEIACKTRKPKTDTQAGMTGVTTDYRKSGTSYDLFFRRCEKGRCPAGDGEEILKDCQCIIDFAEAATATLMINNAAKDMICSSGTKK